MPENIIVHRVYEHVRQYPPFDKVEKQELLSLCSEIKIKYFPSGEIIFNRGDASKDHFYFVNDGSVKLFLEEEIIDHCDQGDIFGVRSMLSGNSYLLRAECHEESLLYLIPNENFRKILAHNSKVAMYFASGLASGQLVVRDHTLRRQDEAVIGMNLEGTPLVSASRKMPVREAAELMTRKQVGSLVITDQDNKPAGIITDTDLRKKIATGQFDINTPVDDIMTCPVICLKEKPSLFEAIDKMLEHNVHHLCITVDGTTNSRAIGIISQRDIMLVQENNPAIIVKEIYKTREVERLADLRDKAEKLLTHYLMNGHAIGPVSSIITKINDALIKKAIDIMINRLEEKGFKRPVSGFTWLSLGSEGRQEQLLRTDLDNAILYQDPPDEDKEAIRSYFLALGEGVNNLLLKCGFEKCPADIMAGSPSCCLSLSEWKTRFQNWIKAGNPEAILQSTIFFDFRAVYGDKKLASTLSDFLLEEIKSHDIFLNYLAKNATLTPPPLSFFKNFMIEKSGEHKHEFDIKKRALMPLVDAARVLSLSHYDSTYSSTTARFNHLAKLEPTNKFLFEEAAMAYDLLLSVRARFGLENNNSGRFVPVEKLNKQEKQMLRNAFVPIKELQQLLEVRFQLDYFRS
ncbi:MAG: DUF294 nucleotidyltransferase-like domain-containing protein [Cyclobacteriaceae bacterium]|nr:DUF294 nucleotidyltransferase-like domain-containing protein [Cyclobacteriaceae bacterium]